MKAKEANKQTQPIKGENLGQSQKLFPLDLHLVFGQNSNGQQLLNVDLNLLLKPEKIEELSINSDIDFDSIGKDLVIKFDFATQEGREKQAIQYFQNGLDRYPRDDYDNNLSPLQNWFVRPTKNGKLQLTESKRSDGKKGVTLYYQLYTDQSSQDNEKFQFLINKLSEEDFRPDAKCCLSLKGNLDTFKKNRVRINADYIDVHLISKQFRMKKLLNFMTVLQVFGDQQETAQILQNPIFKFLQQTEQIQGTLKMASLKKLLELYKEGIQKSGKEFEKQSPEIIKGLFKQQLRLTAIFQGRIAMSATIKYHSQSILVRLLTSIKKYYSFID